MPSRNDTPSIAIAVLAYALGASFFFYAFVQRVSPSIMTEELMREFNVGAAALGVLSGMYFYSYAALQLPVGMLMDKFGPRKLMSISALVCTLASLAFAYSPTLLSASLSRALIGGSVAFAFVGTLTIASLFLPANRFAMATGLLLSFGMCGAIAAQAPLQLLLEQVGWRQLYVMLALFSLVLAIVLFLLVPRRRAIETETAQIAAPSSRPTIVEKSTKKNMFHGLRVVVGNWQCWLCAGIGFGSSATMLSLAGLWAVPWLSSTRGFTAAEAASTASFMFVGMAIGSPTLGWLSEKLGQRKRILVICLTLALVTILIIVYGGIVQQSVLALLFMLNGFVCSSMTICFVLVKAHIKPEHNATALGLINMCVVGAGAVMQPLIGWLLDSRWQGESNVGARVYSDDTYTYALSSLVLATLFAFLCCLPIREPAK